MTQWKAGSSDQPPITEAGLEVSWLVATGDQDRLVRTLAKYVDDVPPADPAALTVWSENGLRLVRIPLADWHEITSNLGLSGATQRQWVAQGPEWVEIVRGPWRGIGNDSGHTIALDSERLDLPPGRIRLLARCWLAPTSSPALGDVARVGPPGAAAALRVEVLPQHQEAQSRTARTLVAGGAGRFLKGRAEEPDEPGLSGDGLVFSRMMLRLSASSTQAAGSETIGGYAYLLIPERPSADWRSMARVAPDDGNEAVDDSARPAAPGLGEVVRDAPSSDRRAAREPSAEVRDASAAGPGGAMVPTLGEALFGIERGRFSADGREQPVHRPASRAIVVLIPRVPSVYQLIPAAAPPPER